MDKNIGFNKLIAIDLDNTLAELNKPVAQSTIKLVKKMIQSKNIIFVISGKPTTYLCGLFRQLDIKNVIVSGENGSEIYFDTQIPPMKYYTHPFSLNEVNEIKMIKTKLLGLKSNYYFQSNLYSVTPFFTDKESKNELLNLSQTLKSKLKYTNIFKHTDCIDFTPKSIDKGKAVEYVAKTYKIDFENIYAIGDNENDIPMYDVAKVSVLVGSKIDYNATYKVDNINQALKIIMEEI